MTKQNLEILRAEFEKQQNCGSTEKFDYKTRVFKPEIGTTKVMILPEEGTPVFYLADGYHVMSKTHYQDCEGAETCPVCQLLKRLWDDEDMARQGTYRAIKRKKRYTYQIVKLGEDGSILDPTPMLWNPPKTVHDIVMDQIFQEDKSIEDFAFSIVKKKGNPYFDYSESGFDDQTSEIDLSQIEERNQLTDGKYYNYDKSMADLQKYNTQFSLGMDFDLF